MKARIRPNKSSRQPGQNKKWLMPTLLVVGFVLLGVGMISYFTSPSWANASAEYDPADVVTDQPVLAVHEMGEGSAIPFFPAS